MIENISSLQKVALVRGFNYERSKELSSTYPFALIFSEGDPTSTTAPSIFQGEYRYTRFINVNPEKKEIQINDHTIILGFDYESGLLSIGDKYILNNIRLFKISYIPFYSISNEEENIYDETGGSIYIDSKNNSFKLEIIFESDDEDNIKYISKELSFDYNEYVQYKGYNSNSLGTIGTYYFNVLKDCFDNFILNGKSTYASNIILKTPNTLNNGISFEYIRFNPQYLHIYEDGINIDNKDKLTLNYDEEINLKAILSCDMPNSVFNGFDIRVENMPEYINFDIYSLSSNEINLNIKCNDIDQNVYLTGSFDINVYRNDHPNNPILHLSKHYIIEVHGEYNDALWYIGDKDIDLININDLMKLNGNIGFDVQNYPINTNVKYFIISNTYDGIRYHVDNKVKPCNNFYTLNYDYPDGKKYVSASNWVEEYTSIEINGILLNVYSFNNEILYNNKFYGKIQ